MLLSQQIKKLIFTNLFASCFFRAHRPWRATWRGSQACWRQTFQTTKTKSFASYVLCKFPPVVTWRSFLKWSVFGLVDLTGRSFLWQRTTPPWEVDRVYDSSRPPQCQELQLRGRVCGGHDQTTQGDVEKQLVHWSRLLGKVAQSPDVLLRFLSHVFELKTSHLVVSGAFFVRFGQLPCDCCSLYGGHVRKLCQCYSRGRCSSGR